jgi:hypothetical protein
VTDGAPVRLSATAAAHVVAELASDSSRVNYTVHARQRMRERRVTPVQVGACLRRGTVSEGPIINLKGNWQMRLTTVTDRQRLDVVVAIEWRSRLIVITAIAD